MICKYILQEKAEFKLSSTIWLYVTGAESRIIQSNQDGQRWFWTLQCSLSKFFKITLSWMPVDHKKLYSRKFTS